MERGGHRNHGGWNRNNRGRGGGPPWRNGNPFHQGYNKGGGPNRNHRGGGNFRGNNQNRFNNSLDRSRDRSPSNARTQNESRDKDTRSLPSTPIESKKQPVADTTLPKSNTASNSNSNSNFLGIGYGSDDDDDELDDGLKIDEGSTEEDAQSEKASEPVADKSKTMEKSEEPKIIKDVEAKEAPEKGEPKISAEVSKETTSPTKEAHKSPEKNEDKTKTSVLEKEEAKHQTGQATDSESTEENKNYIPEKMEKTPPPPPSKANKRQDDDAKKTDEASSKSKENQAENTEKEPLSKEALETKQDSDKQTKKKTEESSPEIDSSSKESKKKPEVKSLEDKQQSQSEKSPSVEKDVDQKDAKAPKQAETDSTKNNSTLQIQKESTPAKNENLNLTKSEDDTSEAKNKILKEAAKEPVNPKSNKEESKSSPKKDKPQSVPEKSSDKRTIEKTVEKSQKEDSKKSQEFTKFPGDKKEKKSSSQTADKSEKAESEKKPPPPPPKRVEKSSASEEKISSKKSISLNNLLKEKEKEINNAEKNASPKTTPEKNTRTRPERTPPEAKRRSFDIVKKEQPKIDRFMTAKPDQGSKVNDISEKLKKQKEGEAETNKSTTSEGRRSERSSRRSTGSRRDSSSRSPERKIEKDSERRKKDDKSKVLSEDIFDREVEKSLGEKKSLRAFSRPDPQKRSSSSMEPDDEKQPEAKKSRTDASAPQDGLMSPTRTKVTSLLERRSSVTKKMSPSPAEIATALDLHPSADGSNDFYCWSCHLEGKVVCCDVCPRVYHEKCLPKVQKKLQASERFFCPECTRIEEAENLETRVESMKNVSLHNLSIMLRNCLSKIRPPGIEIFMQPVDTTANPNYLDYIFHPMDISKIETNIKEKKYGSTDAFLADLKWIKHNCIIFNGPKNDFSTTANKIIRMAETECQEIENCPSCYLGPLTKPVDWFVQVCDKVHPIVWGKLSGYPVWPAKVMCCQRLGSQSKGSGDSKTSRHHVDIRFFGQHDKAWLSVTHVTMHTSEDPYTRPGCPKANKQKKEFDEAIRELKQYIANLERKYGKLKRFPPKTPFDPEKHFDVKNLFDAVPGNVLAKIPPLRKEPRATDKIKTLIKGVSTIINPKPEKLKSEKLDSDDSANGAFDFHSDDDSDDGNKLIISDESSKEDVKKRKPKSEPARAPKRLRSDSPAENAQQQKSKLRIESPVSEKSAPPPPPEGKNAYHRQEKERKEAIKRGRERPPPRATPEPKVLEPPNTPKNGKEKNKAPAKEVSRLSSGNILSEIQGLKTSSTVARDLSPSLNTLPVSGLPPNVSMGQYQDRIMGHFEHIIKSMYGEMLSSLDGNGQAEALRLEVDRLKWQHEMELADMRHNNELTIAEIRQSMENEKNLELERIELKLRKEQEDAIHATKLKQWCAQCGKEAVFYCCWNTAYCDYPCQQGHWPLHMEHCTQSQGGQPPK